MDQHTDPGTPQPSEVVGSNAARGGVAIQIFDEVQRITAGAAMSKSDAFARISERTGRRAGTVAANYYRVARQRGAVLQPRVRRGPGRSAGGRAAPSGDAVIERLNDAVKALADLVRSQEAELVRLREQSEQFQKLRRWMAKNG